MPQSKVSGLAEIQANLQKAKRTLGRPMLRAQARAAAEVIRKQAQQNLRGRTRKWKSGVIKEEVRSADPSQAIFHIGPRIKPKERSAFYLRFMEQGTQAHAISVVRIGRRRRSGFYSFRNKKVLVASNNLGKSTGKFLGIAVFHPGQRPRPWLKPALEQAGDAALQAAVVKGKIILARYDKVVGANG